MIRETDSSDDLVHLKQSAIVLGHWRSKCVASKSPPSSTHPHLRARVNIRLQILQGASKERARREYEISGIYCPKQSPTPAPNFATVAPTRRRLSLHTLREGFVRRGRLAPKLIFFADKRRAHKTFRSRKHWTTRPKYSAPQQKKQFSDVLLPPRDRGWLPPRT